MADLRLFGQRKMEFFKQSTSTAVIQEKPADLPVLSNFFDVIEKSRQLIMAVEKTPDVDFIYFFPALFKKGSEIDEKTHRTKVLPDSFLQEKWNWCIAGSAALSTIHLMVVRDLEISKGRRASQPNVKADMKRLQEITKIAFDAAPDTFFDLLRRNPHLIPAQHQEEAQKLLFNKLPDQIYGNVTANDTDIFFLGSEIPHRMVLPTVDLVHTKAKTVEELLLNFDLPCCRAAYNSKHDYWISAHCLYSLLTGTYPIPAYVKDSAVFKAMILEHRGSDPMHRAEEFLFQRMQERIAKYEKRGFRPRWIETDTVLPWIQNRFHYGEWKSAFRMGPMAIEVARLEQGTA